jgi:hypothetical protein
MDFKGDELKELKLIPISLGYNQTRSQRVRPMIAEKKIGEKILKKLQALSANYGTISNIKDGIGEIEFN